METGGLGRGLRPESGWRFVSLIVDTVEHGCS